MSAPRLAEAAGLPGPMVSKILKQLARSGLVDSARGAHGGYSLTRDPDAIPIGEILEVFEGPIGMTECVANPGNCEQETHCPTRANWERISRAVGDALRGVHLSDMVGPVPREDAPARADSARDPDATTPPLISIG